MANFKTHFFVAAGASGVAALACMKAGAAPPTETPALLALGTFGGLLPDIDSDHSAPIKISFNLLAFTLAFLAMFAFVGRYTVLELAAIWLGVFVAVRWLVLDVFTRLTVHRGAIHSLLAAVFFALCTASLSHHLFSKSYPVSWLYGVFVGFGFVIHLLLDELFSVDLLNRRLKSSFGSAFKIVSLKYWRATLLLLLATAMVYSTVHYPDGFYASLWHKLHAHYTSHVPWLMPSGGHWFDGLPDKLLRISD
jgi:hypothetical protein